MNMLRRVVCLILVVLLSLPLSAAFAEIFDAADETDIYAVDDLRTITDYPILKRGDRDGDDAAAYIVMLQNRLIELGFLEDEADGIYGEATEVAVEQFQKLNGLERTGIADEKTQTLLFSDITALATPSPEQPVSHASQPARVQEKLLKWGFMSGKADGKVGKTTETAIAFFKNYVHEYLPEIPTPTPEPTPVPTPEPTLAPGELPEVMDELIPTPVPEPTPYKPDGKIDATVLAYVEGDVEFDPYRVTVQAGDNNYDVRRIQIRLKQLKYLYSKPDGVFGLNTARAIMYFQRKHGLMETGMADEATQRLMFSDMAEKSDEWVFPYKLVVDISDQRVYALQWNGSTYKNVCRTMICSTGKDQTPTPLGTYQSFGPLDGEWYWFKDYHCYAKWATGIVGGVLFHSVTFTRDKKPQGSERSLGRKASHGCIRLKIVDAKWIYDNCPYGTTIVIRP